MPSITPDPKKRSFLLPAGCKDLMDVLQPGKWKNAKKIKGAPTPLVAPAPGHKHGAPILGRLADIERHVQAVLSPAPSVLFSLYISHPASESLVTISRDHDGIDASVDVELGTDKETILRAFLSRHGLQAPPIESDMPEVFTPGLPVYQSFTISPHLADAVTISNSVSAFFQEIVGLNESSELWFSSFEITGE